MAMTELEGIWAELYKKILYWSLPPDSIYVEHKLQPRIQLTDDTYFIYLGFLDKSKVPVIYQLGKAGWG